MKRVLLFHRGQHCGNIGNEERFYAQMNKTPPGVESLRVHPKPGFGVGIFTITNMED